MPSTLPHESPLSVDRGTRRSPHLVVIALVALISLLAIANVYYGRLRAPADLYRKDQNKTMAYTVDMVLHGRFSLPRDVIYQPATKPPLYNWMAALVVGPTGIYDEWAQKWPSLASSLAIAVLVCLWCRRHFTHVLDAQHAWLVGLLAASIWIASKFTVSLMYIARPDMLQALCLIIAWMTGTATLRAASKRDARWPAIGFWLATTAAALAKGPAAIYPILYVVLASKLCFGEWGRLRNFRWPLGLLTLVGSTGLWLFFAYRQDPDHVKNVLIGTEVVKRIAASNPEGFVKPVWYSAMWFVTQNPYWSSGAIVVVLGMVGVAIRDSILLRRDRFAIERSRTFAPDAPRSAWRTFFAHPAGQATLWILVVIGCLSVPKDKRMDFLLPAHPAVAIVAAYGAVAICAKTWWGRYALPFAAVAFAIWQGRPIKIDAIADLVDPYVRKSLVTAAAYVVKVGAGAVIAAAVAAVLYVTRRWLRLEYVILALGVLYWSESMVQGVYKETRSPGAKTASVAAADFARQARSIVGDAKVVCIIRSKHPLLTLMGRHQGSYLTRQDFEQADYVIAEVSKFPELKPLVKTFKGIPVDYGDILHPEKRIREEAVGLYKIDKAAGVPSVEAMIAIQRWVGDWTDRDANPYRSKGTVWIDSPNDPPMWTPPPGDPWATATTNPATRPTDEVVPTPDPDDR